ncbi:MAG: hypothetical protein AAF570_29470, partial [Bacteroidota bacterium]
NITGTSTKGHADSSMFLWISGFASTFRRVLFAKKVNTGGLEKIDLRREPPFQRVQSFLGACHGRQEKFRWQRQRQRIRFYQLRQLGTKVVDNGCSNTSVSHNQPRRAHPGETY